MAYDRGRKRLVLFGGNAGALQNDTWEWNGTTWSDVSPVMRPLARQGHAMTYDARRGKVVLFGGSGASVATGRLNDTWEWDGTTWTEVTPPGPKPSIRTGAAMTYDETAGLVILSGGSVGVSSLADSWTWDGTSWTEVTRIDEAPPKRSDHGMTYDTARAHVVMYGGRDGATPLSDTWLFRFEAAAPQDERCLYGLDGDGDGKIGCADDDCFGACTPLCNPTLMTCAATGPRCGDGFCASIENNASVESKRLCPQDCGALSPLCGDFLCEAPESAASCPGDCP
jgi:hypothetical protein